MNTSIMKRKGREIKTSAVFSSGGHYRYRLTRDWSEAELFPSDKILLFIMLNPSTATADKDDPTIRRCQEYAVLWGYCRLTVCNLFSYRSTFPQVMMSAKEPVGEMNDDHILECARGADRIVCAWGKKGNHLDRDQEVLTMLATTGKHLLCLGLNEDGTPVHPLYQPKNVQLLSFDE